MFCSFGDEGCAEVKQQIRFMEIQSVIELPEVTSDLAFTSPELVALRAENARLKNEMAQVRAIARIAVEQPDTHTLAKLIAQQAAECMQTRQAWIGLVADDAIRVEAICADNHVQPGDGLVISPGENGAGLVLLKRHTVICVDATRDPLITPDFRTRFGCRSVLSVPMLDHQNEILGVIQWHDRADGEPFSEADTTTAEMIAMQAAVAFERSRIHLHLQQWVNSIESLFAFNSVINERLNPDLLMQRLVEHAVGFLGADGGLAGWVQRDAENSKAPRITARQYFHAGAWHSIQREWTLNQGAPGWVYVYHCPYLANEYRQDLQADALWRDQFGVHYALCVPIVDAESQVLGFIELHKSAGRLPFAWLDAGFLESLANISAIAISNAQLLQALEASRQQAAALSAEHVTWMEEERRSLARELHDETGQVLIGIKLGLQVLAKKIPTAQHGLQQEVVHLREQINQAAVQLKSTARMLRPPTLDELGLPAALHQLATDFEARSAAQVRVQVVADLDARLPQQLETALYRIAQEALTNAVRHGAASHVQIELIACASSLTLTIQDDGSGFDAQQGSPSGLGLLGMRERATMLGGSLTIESAPSHGTRIVATAPLSVSSATRLTAVPSI